MIYAQLNICILLKLYQESEFTVEADYFVESKMM